MPFINVGAYVENKRCNSKKQLREALRDNPASVRFDHTAAVGPDAGKDDIPGTDVPAGVSLTVVGPDPYTSRKWYATVKNMSGVPKVTA